MFYTTVELLAQAYSNFHFIFCFCNVIIIFLLIGSARPSNPRSSPVHQVLKPTNALVIKKTSTSRSSDNNADQDQDDEGLNDKEERESFEERSEEQQGVDHGDHDDDELRRKIEEFIDKVNREWREEKLRTRISTTTYSYSYD